MSSQEQAKQKYTQTSLLTGPSSREQAKQYGTKQLIGTKEHTPYSSDQQAAIPDWPSMVGRK